MFSSLRMSNYLLVVVLILFSASAVAGEAQRPSIWIRNAYNVADITSQLPPDGAFDLKVECDHRLEPADRTALLSAAFADERVARVVELDLVSNELVLPPVVTGLHNVERLCLGVNKLIEPPVVSGLTRLSWLGLGMNELTHAPVLTEVPHLEVLTLNNNQLTEPPVLSSASFLRVLELSHNRLMHAPVLAGLARLEYLSLDNNRLVQPPVLTGLPHLRILALTKNAFERPVVIPPALADRMNLDALRVSYQIGQEGVDQEEIRQQELAAFKMQLVDIGLPGLDAVPFFFTRETIARISRHGFVRNPLTRSMTLSRMNLPESWRSWSHAGIAAADFDARLRDAEPVMVEENLYTVSRQDARDFLSARGVPAHQLLLILTRFEGKYINVTALLDAMAEYTDQVEQPQAAIVVVPDEPAQTVGVFAENATADVDTVEPVQKKQRCDDRQDGE